MAEKNYGFFAGKISSVKKYMKENEVVRIDIDLITYRKKKDRWEEWDKIENLAILVSEKEQIQYLIKENASEEEITKAYSELFRAFSELKLKPSKERLESLINKAEGYTKKYYTKNSFEVLSEKLKEAKKVLKDKNSTEADILTAEIELQKAIDQLVVNNSNNNNSNNNDKNNNNSGNLPLTGGTSTIVLGGIASLLLAAGVVLRKKK